MIKPKQLPSGMWQARELIPGTKRYRSLGTFPTFDDARDAQALSRAGVDITSPKAKPVPRPGEIFFWTYAETHLALQKDRLAPGTYVNYLRDYRKYLEPAFGKLRLSEITPTRVKAWWVSLEHKPLPRRASYTVLSGIMRAAEDDGEIQRWRPIRGAFKDRSTPRPKFSTSDVQMLRMLSSADEQVLAVLWVLASSGLRIGEVLAFTWEEVDFQGHGLRVHKRMLKDGTIARGRKWHPDADVFQPITGEAVAALKRLYDLRTDKSGACFRNTRGEPLRYAAWRERWVSLRAACGLDNMNSHDVRAIHLTEVGKVFSLAETMTRGGHTDVRSAMRYQRPVDDRQREIVAALEGVL